MDSFGQWYEGAAFIQKMMAQEHGLSIFSYFDFFNLK